MDSARLLIVEDSPALAMTYRAYAEAEGHAAVTAHTLAAAVEILQAREIDAVFLDLSLPDASGMVLLEKMKKEGRDIPVAVITADGSVDTAVAAIRAGAEDYIQKPVTPARMLLTLRNMMARRRLEKIVSGYRAASEGAFCGFIGEAPAMQGVYRILENAAHSTASIMITGESGTGKELAARAVHRLSPRKDKVFEALNCAAMPAALLESEIFGHARGAFTGAVSRYAGAASRADGGTLFLDELPEMPMDMQSKLLRFTQERVFRPLGAAKEETADVRFISATNRDPLQAVAAGVLREDLYYRLNVISVALPPLRARGDDVVMIARQMMLRMRDEEKKSFSRLSPDAEAYLKAYPWPGNVRQLQNVMRRAVVLHDGPVLTRDMLEVGDMPAPAPALPPARREIRPLAEVERELVLEAIEKCKGNLSEAARRLGVNPSTLHRKREKWRKDG